MKTHYYIKFINNNNSEILKVITFCKEWFGFDKKMYKGKSDFYILIYNSDDFKAINFTTLEEEIRGLSGRTFYDVPQFIKYPKEIQKALVEYSISKSPIPFILEPSASLKEGGFDWSSTPEGWDFWSEVIDDENFDLFFKTIKHNETELCHEATPIGGQHNENPTGLRYRFNKARITIQSLSHEKVVGRG